MAPKSHNASGAEDLPNPASSSTKETPDADTPNTNSDSQPNSPPADQSTLPDATGDAEASDSVTKSTSASSEPAAKDVMSGPSPYGTRSRNRGQPRPNYAEDKDMDTEMYDAFPDRKEQEAKKASRPIANGVPEASRTGGSSARKVATVEETQIAQPSAPAKDSQTGTAAATPAATAPTPATTATTKKRKANTQPTTNGPQAQPTVASAQILATTRRTATNAPGAGGPGLGFKESNMLSFEQHGAIPEHGKLVADDGTSISKNGRCIRGLRYGFLLMGQLCIHESEPHVVQTPKLTLLPRSCLLGM